MHKIPFDECLEMAAERPPLEEVMQYYPFDGVHWALDLIPDMVDSDFAMLLHSLSACGQARRITIDKERNLLVDGRQRLIATYMLTMEPSFERLFLVDPGDYVMAVNLYRRGTPIGPRTQILDIFEKSPRRAKELAEIEEWRASQLPPWMT